MKLLNLVFNGASLVVDTVGWAFARIVKLLLQGVTSLCGWGIEKIQGLPENIQIPISAMLVIVFLGILLACLWAFPHIVILTLIVVPAIIFLLKFLIGWVVLFCLVYAIYQGIKGLYTRLMSYFNPKKI